MASQNEYNLLVIGAGPGGYVAAIRASQLGLKTAVIEKDKLGGVCLNIGCIPSKALIHQAELVRSIAELEELGVKVDRSGLEFGKVFRKTREAADALSKGVQFLLKKNKVDVINGTARLAGAHEADVAAKGGDRKLTADNILVATGSRPRSIPGFDLDEKNILSSNGALMLEECPKSVVILGAGAIGVEFAHCWNAFGAEVHLVEMLDSILPLEDREVVKVLAGTFRKRGIKIYTGHKAVGQKRDKDGLFDVTIEDKNGRQTQIKAEKILVAIGRAPNSENLGLDKVGVKVDSGGYIEVGDYYQTSVPSIYAIGDVIRNPWLAHVASKAGEIVAEHLAGHMPPQRVNDALVPSAVYCEPQVASFGLSEERAVERGVKFKKATFPYRGAGKAVAVGRSEGLVKILFDPDTHEILGAAACGAEATELIHELLLARSAELLPADIATMIHAHPTLSEAVMEAARAVEGWAIHA
ncbi:MAG: dihydrolipoyl dehydrogenase [Candidatus Sumerlaeia bacterium]